MGLVFPLVNYFCLLATSLLFMNECSVEFPFGLALGTLCLYRGMLGLIQTLRCGVRTVEDNILCKILTSVIEFAPAPLMNYEFYDDSDTYYKMALYHFLSGVPLAFDLLARIYNDGDADANADALKDFFLLINHLSTMYLSFKDGKPWLWLVPTACMLVRYLPGLMQHLCLAYYENVFILTSTNLMLTLKVVLFYIYDAPKKMRRKSSTASSDNRGSGEMEEDG